MLEINQQGQALQFCSARLVTCIGKLSYDSHVRATLGTINVQVQQAMIDNPVCKIKLFIRLLLHSQSYQSNKELLTSLLVPSRHESIIIGAIMFSLKG